MRNMKKARTLGGCLSLAVSLPVLLTGCALVITPGSDAVGRLMAAGAVQPTLERANLNAEADGRATRLSDIQADAAIANPTEVNDSTPIYVLSGDHLNVSFGSGPPICSISIVASKAELSC